MQCICIFTLFRVEILCNFFDNVFHLFSTRIAETDLPAGFPRITFWPSQLPVVEKGRNHVLECVATGTPDVTISWIRDMVPVNLSTPRYIQLDSTTKSKGKVSWFYFIFYFALKNGKLAICIPILLREGEKTINLPAFVHWLDFFPPGCYSPARIDISCSVKIQTFVRSSCCISQVALVINAVVCWCIICYMFMSLVAAEMWLCPGFI